MRFVLSLFTLIGASAAGAATMDSSSPTSDMKVTTGIDHEAIRDAIWLESVEVQACYVKALKDMPELKGKLVIAFEVDETGKAKNLKRETGTILNKDVFSCVAKALEAAEFPPAASGTVVSVKYPFVFQLND